MRLTRDYILNHIRETKYPLWALYIVQNYKRLPIMFFSGDNFTENDTPESKAEKGIERLQNALQELPSDAVLCIELKSCLKANQGGILGPFEFVNHDKGDDLATVPQTGQQFAGLIGYPTSPAGYVSEETLNAKLEGLRLDNERRVNQILLEHKEKDFEQKMQRERQELKELRKELNEEKKKYESNTGAAAETIVFALKKILGEFFPALKNATAAAPQNQLQGVNAVQQPVDDEPHDAKYKAIEELASRLYDNPEVNESDIRRIIAGMNGEQEAETVINQKSEAV